MLREKKEQISTSPVEENPFEFQSEIELYSFKDFAAMPLQHVEEPETPSIPSNLLQPPNQTPSSLFAN